MTAFNPFHLLINQERFSLRTLETVPLSTRGWTLAASQRINVNILMGGAGFRDPPLRLDILFCSGGTGLWDCPVARYMA